MTTHYFWRNQFTYLCSRTNKGIKNHYMTTFTLDKIPTRTKLKQTTNSPRAEQVKKLRIE